MTDLQIKIKFIYLRFLLLQVSFIAVYSLFNWYYFLQRDWLHLDENITCALIPALLCIIPMIIGLLPRMRLLDKAPNKRKNPVAGAIMLAIFATIGTVIAVQFYLLTATGKLTPLQNVGQIDQKPKTKYYTLQQHYVDARDMYIYHRSTVSGKNRSRLDFDDYIVCPIYNALPDTAQALARLHLKITGKPIIVINGLPATIVKLATLDTSRIASVDRVTGKAALNMYGDNARDGVIAITLKNNSAYSNQLSHAWLGVHYNKSMSNSLDAVVKQQAFIDFKQASRANFKSRKLDGFVYLDRLGHTSKHSYYQKAVALRDDIGNGEALVFEAYYQPFTDRNGNRLWWVLLAFVAGSALFWLPVGLSPLDQQKVAGFRPVDPNDFNNWKN